MQDVRLFVCNMPKWEGTLQIPIHLMERKSNTVYEQLVYVWRLLSGGCSQQWPPVTLNWSNCLSSCDWSGTRSLDSVHGFLLWLLVNTTFLHLPFFLKNNCLLFSNDPLQCLLRYEKIYSVICFLLPLPSFMCCTAQVSNQRDRWSNCCSHAVAIKLRHLAPGFWQACSTIGVCIRSHRSLTVCMCWPQRPEGALLSTYALFHCLPASQSIAVHKLILTSHLRHPHFAGCTPAMLTYLELRTVLKGAFGF